MDDKKLNIHVIKNRLYQRGINFRKWSGQYVLNIF